MTKKVSWENVTRSNMFSQMWENARKWMPTPLCGLFPSGFSFLELQVLDWKSNLVQIGPSLNNFKGLEKKVWNKVLFPIWKFAIEVMTNSMVGIILSIWLDLTIKMFNKGVKLPPTKKVWYTIGKLLWKPQHCNWKLFNYISNEKVMNPQSNKIHNLVNLKFISHFDVIPPPS